ncbi:X-ray radiation resistance-associated protein 1 [Phyllobates terribilis]|uniref:X-ray radiation resistance-associated protein 1 n=1 Tax=Phyllobates terribilis TaxID=111132 RepID=UPI003CCABC7F
MGIKRPRERREVGDCTSPAAQDQGLHRMDAASLYVSSHFPARSLRRMSNGGAGQWRAARSHFRTVVTSATSQQRTEPRTEEEPHRTRSCRSAKMEKRAEGELDAALLMKSHRVHTPSDLCAADVSDRGLRAAQWEEWGQFSCLTYVNASENILPLEAFRTFPALRELDLSMNGIHRITVIPGEFPQLEVLDLSYNRLSPGDILQLGVLPRLRVLCLTANRLTHLPPDLSAPNTKDPEIRMFPSLEVFMLDDNLLSHPSVFLSLAGLQRLRLLNLDKNALSSVPALTSVPVLSGAVLEGEVTVDELERSAAADDRVDYVVSHSRKDPDRTEVVFPSPRYPLTSHRALKPMDISFPTASLYGPLMSPAEFTSPPLPNLKTLSLADNKICHDEDVLPVALFPSLAEIIINGNPLTTLRKGDPPLLISFLQQRLGIKVICKKSLGFDKPHLIIPRKEKRKIRTHVPKIPKQPLVVESLLPSLFRLPPPESDVTQSVMSSAPLPPIRKSSSEKLMDAPQGQSQELAEPTPTSEEGMSFSSHPGVGSVFMTQVENVPDSSIEQLRPLSTSPAPEEQNTATDKETELKKIPERFRGYEELYDVQADPGFIQPVGIQSNVRALEYALRRLLVYREYRPRLHSVQKPYIPRENKLGKDPFLPPPQRCKQDVVVEVLSSMRERRHLLEAPLGSALLEGNSSAEHKEAKLLLSEVRRKYKSFHEQAVKRASEVEAGLRDTARQLLQAQGKVGDVHKRTTNGRSRGAGDLEPQKYPN